MIPRGSLTRTFLGFFLLAGVVLAIAVAPASSAPQLGDNAKTLTISLPGPFNGCTFLDPGATQTSDALLDLIRPSAFQTNSNGNLVGENGPIASAELTSLQPETVVYTIAPKLTWSNDLAFTGADLVSWWQRARSLASVQSDGYRAIKSLQVSADGLSVTAIFRTPYADWNLLFRDIEARTSALGCALSNLASRPSLGPYHVASATPTRIVMVMDNEWTGDPGRYGRLVIVSNGGVPASSSVPFASYSLLVDRAQEQTLSAHPWLSSHLGTSSFIEEITFAPQRPFTSSLVVREALSWYLNRQALINQLWGAVTFSPSVAASVLYAQGQSSYPGNNGSSPTSQATSTTSSTIISSTTPGQADCTTCARDALLVAGYQRGANGWVSPTGQPLVIRIIEGPTNVDQSTTRIVAKQWEAAGITVSINTATSDANAAITAALNKVDVAIFARPTVTTPSYVARSFDGPPYADTFPSGFTSALTTSLFSKASANFNPVAASATWLTLDESIMNSFWARPLFTAPSLVEWSGNVNGITGSLSVPGFVDEITGWSSVPTVPS